MERTRMIFRASATPISGARFPTMFLRLSLYLSLSNNSHSLFLILFPLQTTLPAFALLHPCHPRAPNWNPNYPVRGSHELRVAHANTDDERSEFRLALPLERGFRARHRRYFGSIISQRLRTLTLYYFSFGVLRELYKPCVLSRANVSNENLTA